MKYIYFLILIFGLLLFLSAQSTFAQESIEKKYEQYGKLIRLQSKNAPFPSLERANGHIYQKDTFPVEKHYQDSSVFIFVPKGFRQDGKTDFVVYFHGWHNNIDSVLSQFLLIEQFSQAKQNAILVIPQMPKNSPDSHGGKLEKEKGMTFFMNEITNYLVAQKVLRSSKIGNIVLAGHSGGYRVISFILLRGGLPISEVFLFDGLYNELEKFAVWLIQTKGKFVNFYTETGEGTERVSKSLIEDMKAWKMEFIETKEQDCTLSMLENNRIVMIDSSLEHNDIVHLSNNFYKCLITSNALSE